MGYKRQHHIALQIAKWIRWQHIGYILLWRCYGEKRDLGIYYQEDIIVLVFSISYIQSCSSSDQMYPRPYAMQASWSGAVLAPFFGLLYTASSYINEG